MYNTNAYNLFFFKTHSDLTDPTDFYCPADLEAPAKRGTAIMQGAVNGLAVRNATLLPSGGRMRGNCRNVLVELDFMLMSVLNRTTLFENKG